MPEPHHAFLGIVPVQVTSAGSHLAVGFRESLPFLGHYVVRVSEEDAVPTPSFEEEEDGVGKEGGVHVQDYECRRLSDVIIRLSERKITL